MPRPPRLSTTLPIIGNAPDAPPPPAEYAEKVEAAKIEYFDATYAWVQAELARGLKFNHQPPIFRRGDLVCRVERQSYERAIREGKVIHVRDTN